ncbi:MAG: 30S ribosomal protein S1 [Acidiferrobacteraceae bacterium]|jgi:small subunit ribosomal protein S1|nr:30S ribosomal protein S1 [Acidiferrobacteraceae bacterium]MDP6433845.1 30S ribosomal protein S1 [Arenicellales bacterium]MDP6673130.1 30S ribosomal protein S1 [Arenicellales bacterium]MDP6725212.1 30S ribosomal protein S1 [Arenicellales bacterium]|tara:strand:+ start:3104 stop:4786 length:1683 start_codon:yes stop_codon:yes gene_type:complete
MTESFAELFEESISQSVMQPGKVIMAEVVDTSGDFAVVSAGLKSEALIPLTQFRNAEGEIAVKVGDQIEVAIEAIEDGFGNTRLSHEKALRARAWDTLDKVHEEGTMVSGVVTGKVKGGLTVSLSTIRAFLPGSLVDVRPVKDASYLEGKTLEFKIIKLDRARNNVVVSRRAVLENELSAERESLLANLEEGQVVKGIVKNLTDYGAFVSLGAIDGLLHITDIAWKRVKHPSEILSVGDEVQVRVLKFDRERSRVSLGMKQLGEDPWHDLPRRYPENSRLFGRVTNITDYGSFVEIEDGVEGLVHVSEMDWTNRNVHPNKVLQVGEEVEVMVLDIDSERRRISLGLKQCKPNPWEEFAALNNKNDKITGKIKSITDFGVFVGLDGGIDGLIHLSDLSWDMTGEEAVRQYKKGDEVTAVVIAVDPERERISLGVKQASGDPFASFVAEHGKGNVVKGSVESIDARGAVIRLADGVEGYLRVAEISQEHIADAREALSESAEIEAKITSIERKNRRISLSMKSLEIDLEDEVIQEYSGRTTSGGMTLGDKLKEQLSKVESDS